MTDTDTTPQETEPIPSTHPSGRNYNKQEIRRMKKRVKRGLPPIDPTHCKPKDRNSKDEGLEDVFYDDHDENENENENEPVLTKCRKEVPSDYICNACHNQHQPTHWIYDCPSKRYKYSTTTKGLSVQEPASTKVFVSGLPFTVLQSQLGEYFKECGTIANVKVLTFEDSKRCKGQAIVTFDRVSGATAALEMDGRVWNGEEKERSTKRKELRVSVSKVRNRWETKRGLHKSKKRMIVECGEGDDKEEDGDENVNELDENVNEVDGNVNEVDEDENEVDENSNESDNPKEKTKNSLEMEKLNVYVSGLHSEVLQSQLFHFFHKCGSIATIKVFPFDESKSCKGQAIVTFEDSQGVENALEMDDKVWSNMNGQKGSMKLSVTNNKNQWGIKKKLQKKKKKKVKIVEDENTHEKEATIEDKVETSEEKVQTLELEVKEDSNLDTDQIAVFVSGLPFTVSPTQLLHYFHECGKIATIKILTFDDSKRCKGQVIVTFEDNEGVEKALEMDGRVWNSTSMDNKKRTMKRRKELRLSVTRLRKKIKIEAKNKDMSEDNSLEMDNFDINITDE